MGKRANHGLGRIAPPDRDKDEQYLMRRQLRAPGATLPIRKTWRIHPAALNQGKTGTCVGHAWRNFLRAAPVQLNADGPSAYEVYKSAIAMDEWSSNDGEVKYPDGDPRLASGTSVRAGAKAVESFGHLKSYLWAFALQPAIEWVLTEGPVVLGTDWWSSFERPDGEGIVQIKPNATIMGGHAYLWRGVDTKRGLARCTNSWGDDWGLSGDFFIPLRDLERLIAENGEVCTAVQHKIKAKSIAPPRATAQQAVSA